VLPTPLAGLKSSPLDISPSGFFHTVQIQPYRLFPYRGCCSSSPCSSLSPSSLACVAHKSYARRVLLCLASHSSYSICPSLVHLASSGRSRGHPHCHNHHRLWTARHDRPHCYQAMGRRNHLEDLACYYDCEQLSETGVRHGTSPFHNAVILKFQDSQHMPGHDGNTWREIVGHYESALSEQCWCWLLV